MPNEYTRSQNEQKSTRFMKSLDRKYQEWFRDPKWAAKLKKNIQIAEQREWQEQLKGRKVA